MPSAPLETIVYVWLQDLLGNDVGSDFSAKLSAVNKNAFKYGEFLIAPFIKSVDFNSDGLAQIQIVETETPGARVVFTVSYTQGKTVKEIGFKPAIVPNTGSASLTSFAEIN